MSYESAPATLMLATHCVVCGRSLLDAKSVEVGMGPDCREKYGYDEPVSEEARREANKRVYLLALYRAHPRTASSREAVEHMERIRELGLSKLAAVLDERLSSVVIEVASPTGLYLYAPFDPLFSAVLRSRVPNRRWVASVKAWLVPSDKTGKAGTLEALEERFSGAIGRGPKGLFVIGMKAKHMKHEDMQSSFTFP